MKSWMKLSTLVLVAVLSACDVSGRTRENVLSSLKQYLIERYGSLDQSPVSTGILYDLVTPFSRISAFDGRDTCGIITVAEWLQIAHELQRASLAETDLPSHTVFRDRGRSSSRDHVYPLAFLNYRYQQIRPELNADSVIRYGERGVVSVDEGAFLAHRVFAVSALRARTYRGASVRFRVDTNTLYFSNEKAALRQLEMDFDDGSGYRQVRGAATVNYTRTGRKTITVRASQSDGTVLTGKFSFDVVTLTTPDVDETWPVQSHVPYNGQYSSGEAYVYLANGHSTLTRPVIVSEGFDLFNDMNWDELYALLNQQELLETLRAMGYDAVVLNYDDAMTHIQSNAFLVEALLDSVHQLMDPARTSVLIGASMGGLTTRFALAHMEADQRPHGIRTLITFDAPHRGANIPLGLQYWVDFFSTESADAEFLRDALNSPAARQMLIAHFTNPPSAVPDSDPLRAALLNDFAQIGGYPAAPRLAAVANGSGHRQGLDFSPGDQLIRYEYYSFLVDIIGNVWALHDSQPQQIFNGVIDRIWPFPDDRLSVTVQPTWPWDHAPGGTRNTMAQMDTTGVPYGDIVALHPGHCFVPTISSLDLAVADPFYDIAGDPLLSHLTPFDTVYFSLENQEHIQVTPQNFWWFIEEICDTLREPVVVIQFDTGAIRLNWSPVTGARSYRVYATDDVQAWPEVYTATGDTAWMDPDTTGSVRFYRVVASTADPGGGRGGP